MPSPSSAFQVPMAGAVAMRGETPRLSGDQRVDAALAALAEHLARRAGFRWCGGGSAIGRG
jgi:hypothetical protein